MDQRLKILLLDDSEISLEMGAHILEARGYRVAKARNLLEFEEQFGRFKPDIILTDIQMPDISGSELVRILKQDYETERIPVILFSSKPAAELAVLAEQVGADGYVSKSEGVEKLGEMVDDLVSSIVW